MLLNKRISIWYFINTIKWQIVTIIIFAITVEFLIQKPIFKNVYLPIGVPTILGTAVSLLLAFRTSQAYERWWEARIVWGAIVNDSRSFIRQLNQYIPHESKHRIHQFVECQIIWTYSLGETLREQPFSVEVEKYLKKNNVIANNIPNALLDIHAENLKRLVTDGILTEFRQVQLNDTLVRLCDSMGKCERIKKTIFPRSYSVLVHTLIYIFAVILPFTLDDSKIRLEVFTAILLPIVFIAIEKSAILLQDPFENTPLDTPMTSLSQTIETNLLQMIKVEEIPTQTENENFYEM